MRVGPVESGPTPITTYMSTGLAVDPNMYPPRTVRGFCQSTPRTSSDGLVTQQQ